MMVSFASISILLIFAIESSYSYTSCAHQHRHHTQRKWELKSTTAFQIHNNRNRKDFFGISRRSHRYDSLLLYNQRRNIIHHGLDYTRANGSKECSLDDSDIDLDTDTTTYDAIQRRSAIQLPPSQTTSYNKVSRRTALLQLMSLSILSTTILPDSTSASSEIDTTGELFSPKNEMIKGGGSEAARGIKLNQVEKRNESRESRNKSLLQSTGLIQNVYETRFITYLSRFLLTVDPAASAWWKKNTKSKAGTATEDDDDDDDDTSGVDRDEIFAEFAESVEIGLADYFLGPYGSYASVAAAKAGMSAAAPAKSVRESDKNVSLWSILSGKGSNKQKAKPFLPKNSALAKRQARKAEKEAINLARQGVLNLFSLLKARYTSLEEKQQLAILFSLISKPELQPVSEIRGLLGEIDNGTIAAVELVDISDDSDEERTSSNARDYFRLSSRQGGGFSKDDEEIIRVEAPAPLGSEYKPAKIRAVTKPTTRILRINVIDGGQGYTVAPDVIVKQNGVSRPCDACAILGRNGSISEIVVLDPGFGYGGPQARKGLLDPPLPTVEIRERKLRRKGKGSSKNKLLPAKAIAELEYKVSCHGS